MAAQVVVPTADTPRSTTSRSAVHATTVSAMRKALRVVQKATDTLAVDGRVFYNTTEVAANTSLSRVDSLQWYVRALTGLCIASLAGCAPLAYWQYGRLHRVWRIRSPAQARQHRMVIAGLGGFSLTVFLFLVSPIGCIRQLELERDKAKAANALAFRSLVLSSEAELLSQLSQSWIERRYMSRRLWNEMTHNSSIAPPPEPEGTRPRAPDADSRRRLAGTNKESILTFVFLMKSVNYIISWIAQVILQVCVYRFLGYRNYYDDDGEVVEGGLTDPVEDLVTLLPLHEHHHSYNYPSTDAGKQAESTNTTSNNTHSGVMSSLFGGAATYRNSMTQSVDAGKAKRRAAKQEMFWQVLSKEWNRCEEVWQDLLKERRALYPDVF